MTIIGKCKKKQDKLTRDFQLYAQLAYALNNPVIDYISADPEKNHTIQ